MFQPETKGHFGRQNRFKHGPFKLSRTAHPATGDFLQLPSPASGRNLRQYAFCCGVRRVAADHQLPSWIARYVPGRTAHTAQLIEMDDGRQMICMVRKSVAAGSDGRVEQLHGHLWRVERSWEHVDAEDALNRGLELLGQAAKGTFSDTFTIETAAAVSALHLVRTCTARELSTYLAVKCAIAEGVRETIVARLMLAGRLGAALREAGWCEDTRLHWHRPGSGYLPPLPGVASDGKEVA
jgi:hypothetical protein